MIASYINLPPNMRRLSRIRISNAVINSVISSASRGVMKITPGERERTRLRIAPFLNSYWLPMGHAWRLKPSRLMTIYNSRRECWEFLSREIVVINTIDVCTCTTLGFVIQNTTLTSDRPLDATNSYQHRIKVIKPDSLVCLTITSLGP